MRRGATFFLALSLGLLLIACDRPAPPAPQPSPTGPAAPSAAPSADAPATIPHLVRLTAGASQDAELPMVVAIHGLGDRPASFAGLWTALPVPARVIIPQGLEPHGRGHSWFPIRVRGARDPATVARLAKGVAHARDRLLASIAAWQTRYPTRGKPVVTGFSQGGMLSFAIVTHRPEAVAGAVPLAGWLPKPLWPAGAPSLPTPIVALHGEADQVLPLAPTSGGVDALRAAGWNVTLKTYPERGHTVDAAMRRDLYETLATMLPGG